MPRAALLAALLVLPGVAACQDESPAPAAAPSEPGTPLASFDTSGLSVARSQFCATVAPAEAERLLGGPVTSSTTYDNGEPAQLTGKVHDVAHEFGCTWTADDGSVARAWVFAPPVTVDRAHLLARTAAKAAGPGCNRAKPAPAFGSPSAAVSCRHDGRLEASFHGLFGDAWLSCSLERAASSGDAQRLLERAGRWCVAVATAAAAPTAPAA